MLCQCVTSCVPCLSGVFILLGCNDDSIFPVSSVCFLPNLVAASQPVQCQFSADYIILYYITCQLRLIAQPFV